MKRQQGPPTPRSEIIGHNAALAMLGLTLRHVHSDWLKSKWQGELKWNQTGKRIAHKGYSPELLEILKNDPEFEAVKLK